MRAIIFIVANNTTYRDISVSYNTINECLYIRFFINREDAVYITFLFTFDAVSDKTIVVTKFQFSITKLCESNHFVDIVIKKARICSFNPFFVGIRKFLEPTSTDPPTILLERHGSGCIWIGRILSNLIVIPQGDVFKQYLFKYLETRNNRGVFIDIVEDANYDQCSSMQNNLFCRKNKKNFFRKMFKL